MEILRVFNNNVVLASDGTQEMILTGRGIGFQAKPGMRVDPRKVVRTFVPADGRDPDHLAELLAGIAPEIIRVVSEAMTQTGLSTALESQPTLVMALADHVSGAVRRARLGKPIEYPLHAEVQALYPQEYAQAQKLLDALNARLSGVLPQEEVVALAMHLVNAGFATGDLSYTYTMTGVIQQMLNVIEQFYGITLDQHSVSVGRFITHVRYLFVRIHQHRQLEREPEPIISSIRQSYQKATQCANDIAAVVSLRLGATLTQDEIAYLTLHVTRVAADLQSEE